MCDVIIHILVTKLKSREVRGMVKVIEKIDFEPDLSNYGTQVFSHFASQPLKDMTCDGFVSILL